jgi:RNA polymerase sigma-70 factor (ECF subfamily)
MTRSDELIAYIEANRVSLTWRARRLVGDEAEDVMQEATIKAWTHMVGFREDAALSTWFIRVLINTALMRIRHNKARGRYFAPAVDVDRHTAPAVAEDRVYLREIDEWVDRMAPGRRRAYQNVVNGESLRGNSQVCMLRKELRALAASA